MHPARRHALLGLLTTCLLVAVACGGSDGESASAGGDKTVTIKDFAFSPSTVEAKVGDTVTVTNGDGAAHTLSAVDKSFDTGTFTTGSKTIRLTKAGRIEFECLVHPFMAHGVIQVSG